MPYQSKQKAQPRAKQYQPRQKSNYNLQTGPWAKRGAAVGGYVGARYGGPIGGAVGSYVGRRAFHYPAKIFGSGAYGVKRNATNVMSPQVPTFGKIGDYVTISHREYIGDIVTGAANTFQADTFSLNPGDSNTFPWLSNLCQTSYQQYKFDGLSFEYKSFSGDSLNSTNTALGSVFSCINYDWSDEDFTTRGEIENTDWSSSAKPSDNFMIPVEVATKQSGLNGGMLYVLNGQNVPNNVDPKTYYLGKMTIATQGFQAANVNVGSLYVTYKIRLYKPVMTRPMSNALVYTRVREGATNNSPLGLTDYPIGENADTVGVGITNAGTVLQIDPQRCRVGTTFMFIYQVTGISTPGLSVPPMTLSNGLKWEQFLTDPNEPFPASLYSPWGANVPRSVTITDTQVMVLGKIQVTSVNSGPLLMVFAPGTLPAAPVVCMHMYEVNSTQLTNIGNRYESE